MFLAAKIEALALRAEPALRPAMAGTHAAALLELANRRRVGMTELRLVDARIEWMCRGIVGRSACEAALCELEGRFGCRRLAADPTVLLQRVLRRGRIATKVEAVAVQYELSYTTDCHCTDDERRRLGEIHGASF